MAEEARPVSAGIRFDIPAQPLAKAIIAYSDVTGIEILVPGEMLANRRSTAVNGMYAPREALGILLFGTGLAWRASGPADLTLANVRPPPPFPVARIPRYPTYSAALQRALVQVLCRFSGETQPGGYRLAAQLWIGPKGEVTRVGLLGSTGVTARDTALTDLLRHVSLDEPPPPDVVQPATVIILPRQAGDCTIAVGHRS
jgi:hypothetical protein